MSDPVKITIYDINPAIEIEERVLAHMAAHGDRKDATNLIIHQAIGATCYRLEALRAIRDSLS